MKSDFKASVKFLERFHPGRLWVVTSIALDKKTIRTATFSEDTADDLKKWLKDHEQTNIYFSVGEPTRALNKKAERSDIANVHWLHVDVDPRAGEDIKEEQKRILKLLENPPQDLPQPTIIVYSGGGYQGFWQLADPIVIDGNEALAEEAKRYNLQIEVICGADSCHNIDRIMRLPGTVNRPDARKAKKGRVEALAAVIETTNAVYPIETFTPAAQVQTKEQTGFSGSSVEVSGNVARLATVDELPKDVKDWVKVLIVQGEDPDEPDKYPSRSECLFAVCCELVRSGVEDETIFSILTDPEFRISQSVIEKGSNAEKYAIRQIERAREDAIDPWLRKINEKHAVISSIGGRCKVISEDYDHAMKRPTIVRQSFEDFRNRYMNIQIKIGEDAQGNDKYTQLGKWWLGHPNRRQFEAIVFAPGKDVPDAYNLWKGFACEARPGNCELFFGHLLENVCDGVQEYYDYLIGWMANAVQRPDAPGHTAIVMRGRQGTGKGFFVKALGSLFGRHFMQVSDPKHLVGSFNAHLRDCVVLFGDEAFYAGDKKHESILKTLITEELITIEAKGVDAEAAPNCVHLLMASNDTWVVPAGLDDRRFFVLDVSDERMRDSAYFRKVQHELDNGGREALLHHLLHFDLNEFDVRLVPKTAALQQQKVYSMTPEEEWWYQKLREGKVFDEDALWKTEPLSYDVQTDYIHYTRQYGITRRGNSTKLGHFLAKAMPDEFPKNKQRSGAVKARSIGANDEKLIERPYYYLFPTLTECRQFWDANFGGPYDWPEVNETKEESVKDPF